MYVYVRAEDNHSETLWANIDAGCYRNNGQTCRDNAMCHGARRVHYTPAAVYLCLYSRSCGFLCARAWHIIARPVCANRLARVRSLLDRYVRICAVPRYVRASYSHVFETIVRALELSISERLDSVPSTSTTVIHTPVRGGEEISSRDVFPVSANPTRGGIRKRGGRGARGAKGVAEIYLTRISRVRPLPWLPGPSPAYVCARDVNGIFVLTLLARSFVRGDCLPRTIDCRWDPRPTFIRLVFISDLYPEGKNRGRKGGRCIPFARPSVVDTARGDRNMGDAIRSPAKSCLCDTRVSSHVNGRVRSNERSNERSVSNGWTTLDRLRNRWERGVNAGILATALDIAELSSRWKISNGIPGCAHSALSQIVDIFYRVFPRRPPRGNLNFALIRFAK